MTPIENHNKPLDAMMKAKGCKKAHKEIWVSLKENKYNSHYVDKDGEFVDYPSGYITGPATCREGFYVSVKTGETWAQRTFKNGQIQVAYSWAIPLAKEHMTKELDERVLNV